MNLKKQDHLSTLIGSVEIMFKNAENKGIIKNKELYLLNLINKLINYDGVNIVDDDKKRDLSNFYFRLIARYNKILCRTLPVKKYSYQNHLNISHIPDECYDYPKTNKILYWQADLISQRFEDIVPLITPSYLLNRAYDTVANFIIGVNCNFNTIGVICFAITDSLPTDYYRLYDNLNNDVTHMFKRQYIDNMNTILFVSDNVYGISIINIKIKKTTEVFDYGIFDQIFDKIFD